MSHPGIKNKPLYEGYLCRLRLVNELGTLDWGEVEKLLKKTVVF